MLLKSRKLTAVVHKSEDVYELLRLVGVAVEEDVVIGLWAGERYVKIVQCNEAGLMDSFRQDLGQHTSVGGGICSRKYDELRFKISR